MRRLTPLALLAIAVGGGTTSHAISIGSAFKTCFQQNKTYACGEAFTQVFLDEIQHLEAVVVGAQFSGPNYSKSQSKQSVIVGWNPFTWTAKVRMTPMSCAHSGIHQVQAGHYVTFPNGVGSSPVVSSSDTHNRLFCDCRSDPF